MTQAATSPPSENLALQARGVSKARGDGQRLKLTGLIMMKSMDRCQQLMLKNSLIPQDFQVSPRYTKYTNTLLFFVLLLSRFIVQKTIPVSKD